MNFTIDTQQKTITVKDSDINFGELFDFLQVVAKDWREYKIIREAELQNIYRHPYPLINPFTTDPYITNPYPTTKLSQVNKSAFL